MPKTNVLGPTVAEGGAGTDRQKDGNVGNIYGFDLIRLKIPGKLVIYQLRIWSCL